MAAYLTALMASQSAMPVSCPFCLMVRPWTVSSWQPLLWIIFAYRRVFSRSGKIRIYVSRVSTGKVHRQGKRGGKEKKRRRKKDRKTVRQAGGSTQTRYGKEFRESECVRVPSVRVGCVRVRVRGAATERGRGERGSRRLCESVAVLPSGERYAV